MGEVVLALDCGTHAVRTIAFDVRTGESTLCAVEDNLLQFPKPGWVEVDPEALAAAAVRVVRRAVDWARGTGCTIVALGVTNMRETAFAWRRGDLEAYRPGVMWMSQQSAPVVERWRAEGLDPLIRERTGLTNDPFFFGSKVRWLLETDPTALREAAAGGLAVGTVDTWLVHRLTGGRIHRTDTSNGCRTQLMSLVDLAWDQRLCDALGVPMICLPEIAPTMAHYGVTDPALVGEEIPITGVIADQQASLLGHGCESAGGMKATFGTSGVVALNTGSELALHEGLVTSVAWTDAAGMTQYEVEGSAFHSGYTVGWLADRLQDVPPDLALQATDTAAEDRVYLLPSFTALGAPRWPRGRGAVIAGLAMDTTSKDIMRAGVEAMAFQAYDLLDAMGAAAAGVDEVDVDGGGAANDYLCQMLADLAGREVVRPDVTELTSAGAAKAALRGLGADVAPHFGQDRSKARRFRPSLDDHYARDGYSRWVDLVESVLR